MEKVVRGGKDGRQMMRRMRVRKWKCRKHEQEEEKEEKEEDSSSLEKIEEEEEKKITCKVRDGGRGGETLTYRAGGGGDGPGDCDEEKELLS